VAETVYLGLGEFIDIAGLVLGIEPAVVRQVADLGLGRLSVTCPAGRVR
jgi:hypothetical protein